MFPSLRSKWSDDIAATAIIIARTWRCKLQYLCWTVWYCTSLIHTKQHQSTVIFLIPNRRQNDSQQLNCVSHQLFRRSASQVRLSIERSRCNSLRRCQESMGTTCIIAVKETYAEYRTACLTNYHRLPSSQMTGKFTGKTGKLQVLAPSRFLVNCWFMYIHYYLFTFS